MGSEMCIRDRPVDPDELRRIIRRSIGSQVNRVHRRRPMILVYVVETLSLIHI